MQTSYRLGDAFRQMAILPLYKAAIEKRDSANLADNLKAQRLVDEQAGLAALGRQVAGVSPEQWGEYNAFRYGTGQPRPAWLTPDTERQARLGDLLQSFAIAGGGSADALARAYTMVRAQQLSDEMIGGRMAPHVVGPAQAAAEGRPLYGTDANLFTGAPTPAGNALIGQRGAAAAQSMASARASDALAAQRQMMEVSPGASVYPVGAPAGSAPVLTAPPNPAAGGANGFNPGADVLRQIYQKDPKTGKPVLDFMTRQPIPDVQAQQRWARWAIANGKVGNDWEALLTWEALNRPDAGLPSVQGVPSTGAATPQGTPTVAPGAPPVVMPPPPGGKRYEAMTDAERAAVLTEAAAAIKDNADPEIVKARLRAWGFPEVF